MGSDMSNFQSKEVDIVEVNDSTTEEQLEEMAKEYFYNTKESEWGFEILIKKENE